MIRVLANRNLMPGPLDGVRVLDCTHVMAGPYCGRLLAELGADVIKIEPLRGEWARYFVPIVDGEALYFMTYNANKRCLSLNLSNEKGKEIFRELIRKSDVFLENYRVGALDKLGLGYNDIKSINPRLIYASISGFGRTGPYSGYVAHDILVQAMAGNVDVTGYPDAPVRAGPAICDLGTGIYTALAIVSALYYRTLTGKGQYIDMSLFDVALSWISEHLTFLQGGLPLRTGNGNPIDSPYNIYKAKDGLVVVIAGEDPQWNKFVEIIERPELRNDARFRTVTDRGINRLALDEIVSEWTSPREVEQIVRVLRDAGLPSGPVQPLDSVLSDPQAKFRKMIMKLSHPGSGRDIYVTGSTFKLSETPGEVKNLPRPIGGDNNEILSSLLGYSRLQIEDLRREGAI